MIPRPPFFQVRDQNEHSHSSIANVVKARGSQRRGSSLACLN